MKVDIHSAAAVFMACVLSFAGAARAQKIPRVYPVPKSFTATGGVSKASPAEAVFRRVDFLGPECYRIVATKDSIVVETSTKAGGFYALETLRQLAEGGGVPCCVVEDGPDIPLRGVVEGFYGRPWGTEGRLDLIEFMGRYKMNCFIYGPKDDPYHQGRWKELYPENMLADFRRLLAAAKKNHVKFYWAVHLGDAFQNPDPAAREEEYAALWRKLSSMYDAGVRSFAVFFDDFGNADAVLHAEIANRIKRDFLDRKGDCEPLIVCPNDYVGDDRSEYSNIIGQAADKDIRIMWTGMGVCSDITAETAAKRAKALRRAPFIWWNWPVNDFVRSKLPMGRTYGVEEYPYSGFVSNPMENLEASKVALFGIADMLWNRGAFDSMRNWRDAMERLYPFAAKAMLRFCVHNADPHKESGVVEGFWREESERFAKEFASGGAKALLRECEANAAAARELSRVLPANAPKLWREIRYWVAYFGAQAREGAAAAKGDAAAYAAAKEEEREIQRLQKAYFQSLAPEWDRHRCMGCVTATRHLQKAIDDCAKAAFRDKPGFLDNYFPALGTSIGTIPAIAGRSQHFERGETLLVMDEILERISARPGDWFGMKMSKNAVFNYIWLHFDSVDAATKGCVEVSRDGGETWQQIQLESDGLGLLYGRVDARECFNAVRWINVSGGPVDFKIRRFNVDLP